MAKAFTKSQTAATLADLVGITRKPSVECLDELAELADSNLGNAFTLPGVGKMVVVERNAHVGRSLTPGETITVKVRRVVKRRPATADKDAILGGE
jgi:DNA-binding protein HU-beta